MREIIRKIMAAHHWVYVNALDLKEEKERFVVLNDEEKAVIYDTEEELIETLLPLVRSDALQCRNVKEFYLSEKDMEALGMNFFTTNYNPEYPTKSIEEIRGFIEERKRGE